MNRFTPKNILLIAGSGSVTLALMGYFGILGPTPDKSVFGDAWWLSNVQNITHLLAGAISLTAGLFFKETSGKILVWVLSIISIIGAILSIFARHILMVNLSLPVEEVLYFTLGNIGLWIMFCLMRQDRKQEFLELQKLNKIMK